MSARLPFTKRERRRMAQDYGHRPKSSWGGGDLPAPWCQGDIVELVGAVPDENDGWPRLRGMVGPFFVVTYACSIGEDDAWYFRVADGSMEGGSDRLHVFGDTDWMAAFRLVDTIDPDGLTLRRRLLDEGWSYTPPPVCESCGQTIGHVGASSVPTTEVGQ